MKKKLAIIGGLLIGLGSNMQAVESNGNQELHF